MSEKYEKKLVDVGDKLEKKFEEKGWKGKMNNFFMKKLKMEKFTQGSQSARNNNEEGARDVEIEGIDQNPRQTKEDA